MFSALDVNPLLLIAAIEPLRGRRNGAAGLNRIARFLVDPRDERSHQPRMLGFVMLNPTYSRYQPPRGPFGGFETRHYGFAAAFICPITLVSPSCHGQGDELPSIGLP